MVSYKELGLVNTVDMFAKAIKGGYAIPGYNFNNMEQLQAIVGACVDSESPVILQVSAGARKYANQTLLRYMAQGAVEFAKEIQADGKAIPIALHLDHGADFETCKSCIDLGFSSVMYDGSHHSLEKNIEISKQVTEYAHSQEDYVTVECELGVLAGIEDDVVAAKTIYTDPEDVIRFKQETNCDSLAIAIGTSHGANKFTPDQCTKDADGTLRAPPLRFDILDEIEEKLPGFPIVLHGSSSIPKDFVAIINENGGNLSDAVGIAEDQLRTAASKNVTKINIDSDGRLVFTAMIRKTYAEHPEWFDPRQYLGPARESLRKLYARKNKDVLGSAGHAFD